MATWLRPRSLRTGRSVRHRHDSEDDTVQLDITKDPLAVLKEILCNVMTRHGISKGKKIAYLNCLVKLCEKHSSCNQLGLPKTEIFCCLQTALVHDAKEVRAAGLRAFRYLISDEEAVNAFLAVNVHHLVTRSLDVVLDNHIERVQALRLMRKLLHVCPAKFPFAFSRCLVAIASDGAHERDRLLRACLATLSELALLNVEHCVEVGGIHAILHNTLDCPVPRINEALVATILYLLNHPDTRKHLKNISLEQLLAPFTDCHYRHSADSTEHSGDDKELRFIAGNYAILSALRSWPGMIYLCRNGETGLRSLVSMLYLPYLDIQKGVMDILFDLFRLPMPEWTDDIVVALTTSDRSTFQDSWKLCEGFIAEEGRSLLPHIANYRPNLIDNYLALLLLTLIDTGLFEALVEVITTSNMFHSVRATILLGELLHLANTLLPHECSHHSHCLPTLMAKAASFEVQASHRHQANSAVTYLSRLHALKKRGNVPCSLFLNQFLHFCPIAKEVVASGKTTSRHRKGFRKDSEDSISFSIKDTAVNTGRDPCLWDWSLIGAVLKVANDTLRKMEDSSCKSFIRRLVNYYKPTSKQFSCLELPDEDSRKIAVVGCLLMDFLLDTDEMEGSKLLDEFLTNFGFCINQISTEKSSLEALLSPYRILNTCSQYYFLFIGRLSHTNRGRKALERNNIFQYLLELISVTSHDCYIKLIVSTLDYSVDGLPRVILTKVLTSSSESSRLYATHFMRVLVRLHLRDFYKWGMELLISQVYDKSRAVSLAVLDTLDEACEDEQNLEAMIHLRPSLLHLGDKGLLLIIRFLSVPNGLKFLSDANFVMNELDRWKKSCNVKYVKLVESELNDSLTRHQKDEDGNYGRRSSQRHVVRDVYVPHHIYGQLAQHKEGLELLLEQDCLTPHIQCINKQQYDTPEDIIQLKASLWALGHVGTSEQGLVVLNSRRVILEIVKLAEECPVFSVRGTCFYVMGLLASTAMGADLLAHFGWESLRRSRDETWPVIIPYGGVELEDGGSTEGSVSSRLAEISLAGYSPSPEPLQWEDSEVHRDDHTDTRPFFTLNDDVYEERKPDEITRNKKENAHFDLSWHNSSKQYVENQKLDTANRNHLSNSRGIFCKQVASHSEIVEAGENIDLSQYSCGESQDAILSSTQPSVRRTSVNDSGSARGKSHIIGKMFTRQWSQTLPLSRPRDSDEASSSRQRSQSVTQAKPPSLNFSRVTGDVTSDAHFVLGVNSSNDGSSQSLQSSPRSLGRLRPPRLMFASGVSQRRRSRSFTTTDDCSSHSGSSDIKESEFICIQEDSVKDYRIETVSHSGTVKEASTAIASLSRPLATAELGCVKDHRSDSNESSQASKSRSDSCTTDSTSGFSSYDSNPGVSRNMTISTEHVQALSPIASSTSLNTLSAHTMHHSDVSRRLANLRNTPVILRKLGPLHNYQTATPDFAKPDTFGLTLYRDALGYATLRNLQRRRVMSTTVPPDARILFQEDRAAKARSLDSRLDFRRAQTCDTASLTTYTVPDWQSTSTTARQPGLEAHSGNQISDAASINGTRYVGLCLPVDTSMVFTVDDIPSQSTNSAICRETDINNSSVSSELWRPHTMLFASVDEVALKLHRPELCLACHRVHTLQELSEVEQLQEVIEINEDIAASTERLVSKTLAGMVSARGHYRSFKIKNDHLESSVATSPGSVSSIGSTDALTIAASRLTEDSTEGKELICKEVMRFVTNLSSSVAVKSAEQGLLNLKQKFPKAFQDLCLYSEICLTMATYNFRLTARRFIQELFWDLSFDKLFDEAMEILGLPEVELPFVKHTGDSH